VSTEFDCWGPYRCAVEERLDTCDDYLRRLRRSLAGEIAPDRFYFGDKAHALRDAAQVLVDHVEDVEWWLGGCTAETGAGNECGRASGHAGPHRPDRRERRVLAIARAVAAEHRRVTDRLAWGLLTVRAEAGVTDPRSLAAELRQVGRRLSLTVSSLEAMATTIVAHRKEG
jgi:hypothetical protein